MFYNIIQAILDFFDNFFCEVWTHTTLEDWKILGMPPSDEWQNQYAP